jgi:DNA-binding response OmpR family regulator
MSPSTPRTGMTVKSRKKRPSVLIVEDNDALGDLLEIFFVNSSFEVSRTTDGVGGLQYTSLMDFDLILCDMVMPNMSGDLFYLGVQKVKPYLCSRFIFMTGRQEDPKWEQFALRTGTIMLWKPFPPDTLLNAIREVMPSYLLNELSSKSEVGALCADEQDSMLPDNVSPQLGVNRFLRHGFRPPGDGWATN